MCGHKPEVRRLRGVLCFVSFISSLTAKKRKAKQKFVGLPAPPFVCHCRLSSHANFDRTS